VINATLPMSAQTSPNQLLSEINATFRRNNASVFHATENATSSADNATSGVANIGGNFGEIGRTKSTIPPS
jgi:hypothetical protein